MKACVLRLRADRLRRFQPTIAIIRWITIPGGPPLINITGDDSFAIDRKIRGGRHRGHRRVRFRAHIRTPLPPLPPLPLPARRSCRLLGCVRARVCVEERVRRRGVVGGGGGGGRELAICQVTAERLE